MTSSQEKRLKTIQPRTTRNKAAFLEQIKKTPVVQLTAEKIGIARATIYRWREADKKFAEEMDKALQEGTLLVNDVAESQLMAAIRERNMTAIIFWLKHHHPAYTTKVEINATINDRYELTPEQRAVVQEALRLAALPRPQDVPTPVIEPDHAERKTE